MSAPARRALRSWGRVHRSVSRVWRVESRADVLAGMRAAGPRGVIARGFGRSYGDECLNDGGEVLDLTPLASIHSFDAGTGVLRCGAGTSFRAIMRHCVPLGWQPAVCPGTAWVSMGGAVANDVHGKNQHRVGSFGDHVDWFELLLPDGSVRRVTRESDGDLFSATVGGIGLTGVVLSLQLRMARVHSNAIELTEIRVRDLDGFLELLSASDPEDPFVVGWVDALSGGRGMGRGILELGRSAAVGVRDPLPFSLDVPVDFPRWVLNRHSVRLFNAAYWRRVPSAGRRRRIHLDRFLYPLDAIRSWNRMYGPPGVYQFQCVVPYGEGRRAIVELMEEITRRRCASFLAVLKTMEGRGPGLLSFPMPGFTLALDFPRRPETSRLISRLQEITLKYGGRVYLAKDACLSAEELKAMYPELERFRAVLRRVDPEGVMQSDMSRRLRLNPG